MKLKRLRILPIPDRRLIAGSAVILWIAISPWVWGFSDSHSAVANHVALVFGFGPLALLIVNLRPAAFVTLVAGAWLAISPWLLGYATDHAAWLTDLISGLLLVVLCASAAELRIPRHRPASRTQKSSASSAVAKTAASSSS